MWFWFHYSGLTVSTLWMRPHEVCFRERERKNAIKNIKSCLCFVFVFLVAFIFFL